MEWLKEILNNSVDEEGKLDTDKAIDLASKELPKNYITKEVFNQKNDDLKEANLLVENLKKDNADVEGLQKQIEDYEGKIESLQTERLEERKTYTLKEKLKEAGAKDIDYMMFKLGEVEVDEDGNIKDLDNRIKSLQEENSTHFDIADDVEQTDDAQAVDNKGYEVLDNKLEDGKESNPAAVTQAEFEAAVGIQQQ